MAHTNPLHAVHVHSDPPSLGGDIKDLVVVDVLVVLEVGEGITPTEAPYFAKYVLSLDMKLPVASNVSNNLLLDHPCHLKLYIMVMAISPNGHHNHPLLYLFLDNLSTLNHTLCRPTLHMFNPMHPLFLHRLKPI
ncbi:hypothetical protein VNO77_22342 [Canavalia gladiata]|uniref:Uncharacterized protein n=1 Tax=Canavalia gladiata TaxID=3824 RepID=A0AAN9L2E8_CANGL